MDNRFDTTLVVLYPVDKQGNKLLPDGKEDKNKPKRYVKVDGERREVPDSGVLIEKWKAEYITQSLTYFYPVDHQDLTETGLMQGEPDYTKRLGAITQRGKFAYRIPASDEIMAAIAPIDEQRIEKLLLAEPFYANVMEEFGTPIRAALRTNPNLDIHRLFDGFANVMPGYKEILETRKKAG